jgi:uncharacterized membrane protein affecting hemolysin expression
MSTREYVVSTKTKGDISMKKLIALMIGMSFVLGSATLFAQDQKEEQKQTEKKDTKKKKAPKKDEKTEKKEEKK